MTDKTQEIMDLDAKYYMNCFGQRPDFIADHGQGSYLYDEEGNAYLDLLGGIAVNVLGYGNQALVSALTQQVQNLIHCSNLYYNRPQTELAAKLAQLTGYDKVFFANSGAEANEGGIKLARAYFYSKGEDRYEIISLVQSFHGRTLATLTATGQEKFHKGFAPLPAGFINVPFGDLDALKQCIGPHTAAVLVEPIQGESGVYPLGTEYLQALRRLCDETGILLICDEIQSGMARSGSFLAANLYGVKADISTLAKGLGGGVPIGAILATDQVAAGFHPGMHGTTFGGNPLACRAGLTVLAEYERLNIPAHTKEMGDYFRQELEKVQKESGKIREIRGAGLMIGFDLTTDTAVVLKDKLRAKGFLVNACTPFTIRLLPPLILQTSEIDEFIKVLRELL